MSLYKVGSFYFVLDGHHRVSVASYHGVEWIDGYVTEFGAAGLWSERRDRETGLLFPIDLEAFFVSAGSGTREVA